MPLQGGLGGSSLGGGLQGGQGLQQLDGGLARPQRSLVRQHVIAALEPLLKINGLYLHSIVALPMPLRTVEDLEYFKREVQGSTPTVAVALGTKGYTRDGLEATEVELKLEIAVYIASSNARSFVAGRLEQDVSATSDLTADPGIETILEHVEALLLGQELGLSTVGGPLVGESEEPLFTLPEYSVWAQTYSVEMQRDVNVARSITAVLTSIAVMSTPDGVAAELEPGASLTETVTTLEVPAP